MIGLQTRSGLRRAVLVLSGVMLGFDLLCSTALVVAGEGAATGFSIDLAQGKPTPKKASTPAAPATGKPREPATAEEAAKALDLRTFPLIEGAKLQGQRLLPRLMYEVESAVKPAYAFQQKKLLEAGWKELPGSQAEDTYASGFFSKDGFVVYVSISQQSSDPKKTGMAQVMVGHYGNVDTAKLPVPKGVKPFYSTPAGAAYITEANVQETAEALRKLLVDDGWIPYGTASSDPNSPMMYFKRNAVRVMAWVSSAPAQGGKTVIQLSSEQLSADLPMPPTAPDARYNDDDKTIRFDWPGEDGSEVVNFYLTELTKKGWKATTERPVTDDKKGQQFLIFRNSQKDMISLDLNRFTGIQRVLVQHRTAAEVAEMDRQIEEAAERARLELAKKNMKFKVPLPLPAQAKKVEQSRENLVEFTMKTGSGPGAFDGFREHFAKEGWKEEDGTEADANTGRMNLKKEDAALSFRYFDTGLTDAEITISGTKVILEPSKGKSAAGDDVPKTAAKGSKKPSLKDIPGLPKLPDGVDLPDLGDVPDDVQDLVKKALEEAGAPAKQNKGKGTKGAPGKKATPDGAVKVAEIPIPEDATEVEYKKTVKMISVKTPSDARTLATFFTDGLIEKGWSKVNPGLVDDNSAILKLSQGESEITIFIHGKADEGSEATLTTRGLSWDSVPPSKKSAKKTVARADKKNAEKKNIEKEKKPDDDDDDDDKADSDDAPKKPAVAKKTFTGRPVTVAEQKQTGTKLTINDTVYKLEYGVAFESTQNDRSTTEVLLTEKPIAVDRIIAALKLGKEPDVAGFQRHLKFRFDDEGKLSYLFMYADGLSINRGGTVGPDFMDAEIVVKDGRARGKGVMKAPEKFFDQHYRIEATFDAKMATGPADPNAPQTTEEVPADGLIADEEDGLPFPDNKTSRLSTTTPFRKTVTVVVPSTVEAVSKFYLRELPKRGWKENAAATKIGAEEAALNFIGADGNLSVKLTHKEGDVTAVLATRNAAKAKAEGILPQANRGRLILGNASNQNVVLTINGQQYKLAAMKGAKDPKDGTTLHVLPGKYTVSIQTPGQAEQKEDLNIAVDEVWGVIIIPMGGLFADQLY